MNLDEARRELDELDGQIATLFIERMAVIDQIKQIKKRNGAPVNQPDREKKVLDRLTALTGHAYDPELTALYQSIFTISKTRQAQESD